MKKLFIFLLFILPLIGLTQVPKTMILKYACSEPVQNVDNTGKATTYGNLLYDAYFLKKDNKYLFYKIPQFLTQTDQIDFLKKADEQGFQFSFDKDSIQGLTYRDADSLYHLVRIKNSKGYQNNKFEIFKGDQKWEVLPETKKIDRYNCQKAVLKDDGDLVWEIWFAPEIPLEFGLANLNELPGLIVEAKLFYPLMEFKLVEYQANIEISKETIKPALLNPPYKELSRESYENSKLRMRKLRKTNGVIQ